MGGLYLLNRNRGGRNGGGPVERWGKGGGGEDGEETVIQVNKLINLIKILHGGNFKKG